MEKSDLSRKEREYRRHRQEIIDTALNLFAEKGYHNVSIQEIAKQAEFSVGTFYKFFSNKEELYSALLQGKGTQFYNRLTAVLEKPGSELEKIKRWIEEKMKIFYDNLDFVRLYFAETRGVGFSVRAGMNRETKKQYEDIIDRVGRLFQDGIQKQLFKNHNAHHMAVALDGISNAFIFEHIHNPEFKIDIDLMFSIFFNEIYQKGAGPNG